MRACAAIMGARHKAAEDAIPVPASQKREAASGEQKKRKRKRQPRLPKGCVASAVGIRLRLLSALPKRCAVWWLGVSLLTVPPHHGV